MQTFSDLFFPPGIWIKIFKCIYKSHNLTEVRRETAPDVHLILQVFTFELSLQHSNVLQLTGIPFPLTAPVACWLMPSIQEKGSEEMCTSMTMKRGLQRAEVDPSVTFDMWCQLLIAHNNQYFFITIAKYDKCPQTKHLSTTDKWKKMAGWMAGCLQASIQATLRMTQMLSQAATAQSPSNKVA